MTRSARRWLFYALVAVFFVLGAGIVLYAQGWRFDFATRKFDKIGAIYVRSFPADTAITLSGKPVQSQVGFLTRSTLIGDLFPKNYRLTLTTPGYDDWHENVSVSPSLVSEFAYAVLVPRAPAATSTATGTASGTLTTTATLATLASTSAQLASMATANNHLTLKKGNLFLGSSTIASDVQNFSLTPDGSLVAVLEHRGIEIFSLHNLNDPNGYYRFNVPNVGAVIRLIWYRDRNHLFVVYKNSVSFLDFTDIGLNNFTTIASNLATTTNLTPAYDPQTNSLYLMTPKRQVLVFAFPQ